MFSVCRMNFSTLSALRLETNVTKLQSGCTQVMLGSRSDAFNSIRTAEGQQCSAVYKVEDSPRSLRVKAKIHGAKLHPCRVFLVSSHICHHILSSSDVTIALLLLNPPPPLPSSIVLIPSVDVFLFFKNSVVCFKCCG